MLVLVLFLAAACSSAALLFMVQPMTARGLLPLLGGSPAVWATSMLFFQSALLAGYAWAHAIAGRRGLAWVVAHAGIAAAALAVLLVRGWVSAAGPGETAPIVWMLIELALGVGGGFVVLAASGPLLQRWYARTGRPDAHDPYFLFAAGNAGSLAGLLGYPFVVEPLLDLNQQRGVWTIGVIGALLLVLACGVVSARSTPAARPAEQEAEDAPPISWRTRLTWCGLAFVPSSLMLGVTTHLTTDVAAFPMLWVVPLAIYLLTFIVAFGRARPGWLGGLSRATVVCILAVLAAMLLNAKSPLLVIILLHLAVLAVGGLTAHTRLALLRPPTSRLTEFYLLIAFGGALGGVFNGAIAPLVFDGPHEYPIALVLLGLCLASPGRRWAWAIAGALVVYAVTAWVLFGRVPVGDDYLGRRLLIGVPLVLVFLASRRAGAFAGCVAAVFIGAAFGPWRGPQADYHERTFFGVHRVETDERARVLLHGTTVHGVQLIDKPRLPSAYYHPAGPAGEAMAAVVAGAPERPLDVALVGMGIGSMAAYARPGDRYTFFEIDPAVVRIAQDPELFGFINGSPGEIDIRVGDGRLLLAEVPEGTLDVLVVDAFSSDSIPVHLLTLEAFELYRSRLREGGVLIVHLSNVHLRLTPIVAAIARDLGLDARVREDSEGPDMRLASTWAVLADGSDVLGRLVPGAGGWNAMQAEPKDRAWTDGYSNVVGAIRWD